MKIENESINTASFERKIGGLSKKKQLQVRACFETYTIKGTNGMKFEQEWILQRIVMHMKSPRLCEHIRTHKLIVV
ncbi:hypothetical protein HPB47_000143 [Ixodes persulcatus]|uniref:Uncharacterized protein n=1 Tax=Ixodes persulcatus TaxID=34615 RepID=A0AC60PTX9_IXOPE|nr:hypothetical protein HPB47_000143 [Ixodes persulcatus]